MSTFAPTLDQSRAYFEDRLGVRLLSRNQVSVKCPFHEDREPSMSLNLGDGVWKCFVCDLHGGILDFERKHTGKPDAECWEAINRTIGRDAPVSSELKQKQIVATYDYRDASDQLVYQSVRYEPKNFSQRRPDGKGGFTWNMEGVERVPFNLPLLVRANVVLIAEGEKDALSLQSAATEFPNEDGKLVYAATTNVAGAGKWQNSYSPYLAGKQVFVFADNDEKGRNHALEVCSSVRTYAREVRLMYLPDLPEKGDVSDYLQAHSASQLFALMQTTAVWSAPGATLVPQTDVEAASMAASKLLATCKAWVLRYVVVSEAQAMILAVWVLHTYVLDATDITPYLHITAAEKECGKSLLLSVLGAIVHNPRSSGGMTTAALIRTIDKHHPALFLDEMDTSMGSNKEYAEAVRGVLNMGFHRDSVFTKCDGPNNDTRDFNVFCCKAFAGIGQLADTITSRSIVIEMRRKLPSESVSRFLGVLVKEAAAPIKAELEAWRQGAVASLRNIDPKVIDALGDRQNDIVRPLLAIAELAGGAWLSELTTALLVVCGSSSTQETSQGALLLSDIRYLFNECSTDRMSSKELVERLCGVEGRPWPEWSHGRPMSPNQLAKLLGKYRIHSRTTRIGAATPKAYHRSDFDDSWDRYCPPLPATSAATTPQPTSSLDEVSVPIRNMATSVADGECGSSAHNQRVVAAVADGTDRGGMEVLLPMEFETDEPVEWV